MARKPGERTPYDEMRLRVRPHVKVHLTVRSHRKTALAFSKPESRGILVGLWLCAGEAFAGRTGGEVTLTPADLTFITGRRLLHPARTSLQGVCDLVGYSVRHDGDLTVVTVRNFAKKNGWSPTDRGVGTPTPAPSEVEVRSTSREKKKPHRRNQPEEPASTMTVEAVDALPDEFFMQLEADRPDLAGIVRHASDVRAWLRMVVPKMRAKGHVRLKSTATNWWTYASGEDVREAIARDGRAFRLSIRDPTPPQDKPASEGALAALRQLTIGSVGGAKA